MTVMVGNTEFRVGDKVSWQLMGGEDDRLEMIGHITAIRITLPVLGVVKDINGQRWLVELEECEQIEKAKLDIPSGILGIEVSPVRIKGEANDG